MNDFAALVKATLEAATARQAVAILAECSIREPRRASSSPAPVATPAAVVPPPSPAVAPDATPLPAGAYSGEIAAKAPEAVALIKRLHAAGRSLESVAAELNSRGIHTARRGRWYAATVATALKQ